jgi:hypothetical protein
MKKSLQDTNPHLKDPKKREEALTRNVRSSSAVEGISVHRDSETGRFHSTKKAATPDEKKSSR